MSALSGEAPAGLRERLLACVGPYRSVEVDPEEQVELVLELLARASEASEAGR